MSKPYSVEELRQKTQLARQNRSNDYSKACDEAFDSIVQTSKEKIDEAIENGRFRAYLYTWHYVEDKNDRKYTFNNVRMLDIVTKGGLIEKLREHFSSDDDNGLYVDWHKFKNSDNSAPSKYGIYVSWAEHQASTGTTSSSATEDTIEDAPAPAVVTKPAPKPASKPITIAKKVTK